MATKSLLIIIVTLLAGCSSSNSSDISYADAHSEGRVDGRHDIVPDVSPWVCHGHDWKCVNGASYECGDDGIWINHGLCPTSYACNSNTGKCESYSDTQE